MKKICVLLLCFLLCGCANNNENIDVQIDNVFNNTLNRDIKANNYTNYIEYYLPSDLNEDDADKLSFVFDFENEDKIIMNINISNILIQDYNKDSKLNDDGFFDEKKIAYHNEGQFNNINDELVAYFFRAYEYDDKYLLYLNTDEVTLYGYSRKDKVAILTSKMLELAKNCNVYNDKIISDFSTRDVIDYEKNPVNLFEPVFPVDGRIDDMMVDKSDDVPQE